jgi:hypothetical protein
VTEYENKSGTVALRGLHTTGRLDDDGLPEIGWYGALVESVTMAKLITLILDAVGYRDLDRTEQGVIMDIIVGRYERDFQRKAARRIVRGYLRGV